MQYLEGKTLTKEFDVYKWEFKADYTIDKLQFAFGKISGKVYFDSVSCKEKGSDDEMVINGGFEGDDLSKWEVIGYNGQTMAIEELDTPAGISTIKVDKPQRSLLYNLAGQVVDENYKGLVIQNGQKRLNR